MIGEGMPHNNNWDPWGEQNANGRSHKTETLKALAASPSTGL